MKLRCSRCRKLLPEVEFGSDGLVCLNCRDEIFGPCHLAEQPAPKRNDGPEIADLVMADMAERKRVGMERYGVPLQPHNGRDALRDLYEELLDACVYVRQEMEERKDLRAEIDRLREELREASNGR